MKHLLLTLTISAASVFNAAKANEPITPTVLASFRTSYAQAQEVHWADMGNTYRASFKLDGKYATAYYAADGNWLGTSRNISVTELLPKTRGYLRKEMKRAWVSDLIVLSTNEGDVYFATLESADTKKVVKSDNGRKWSEYQTFEK
jgi:hypothetical protein